MSSDGNYNCRSSSDLIPRFNAISSSEFLTPIEHRIKEIIALICRQTGWSLGVVKSILKYDSNLLLKIIPEDKHGIIDSLDDLDEITDVFTPTLTKNIVKAWRRNFTYSPYAIFGGITLEEEDIESPKWGLIKTPASEKDINATAFLISELLDQEPKDINFFPEASVALVLLGIDSNNNDFVSKGIRKLKEHSMIIAPSQSDLTRIFTTMALGYAFLNDFSGALESVSQMEEEGLDSAVLGFAGSLASNANKHQEAIILFGLAFKRRKCPLSWPLTALGQLDSRLFEEIIKTLNLNKIPMSLDTFNGDKVLKSIEALLSYSFRSEMSVFKYLAKKGARTQVIIENMNNLDPKPIEITGMGDTEFDRGNYSKELWKLLDNRLNILQAEKDLLQAQAKREWGLVKEIAVQLDSIWADSINEIEKLSSDTRARNLKDGDELISQIFKGGRDPLLLEKGLLFLKRLYDEKSKLKVAELAKRKGDLFTKMRSLNIEQLWPKEDLNEKEFLSFEGKIIPMIRKAEKIRDLEKGIITLSDFINAFESETERESIIKEVFERIGAGIIFPSKNLADIICSFEWKDNKVRDMLNLFLFGTRKTFEKARLEEKHILQIIIPIIASFSKKLNLLPVEIVLQNSLLIEGINNLLQSKEITDLRAIFKALSGDGNYYEVIDSLIQYGDRFSRLDIHREFFLKWVDIDEALSPAEKIRMLSAWVDKISILKGFEGIRNEIFVLRRLRDALVEDNRRAEATLLVSSIWRALEDQRIFMGFEDVLFHILEDLLLKGEESKGLAKIILENPEWLINQRGGVSGKEKDTKIGKSGILPSL